MSDLVYQNYSNKCRGWSNPFIGPQITNLSGYQSSVSSTSIITINGYNFYPYSRIVFGTLNPTTYFVNSTILRFYINNLSWCFLIIPQINLFNCILSYFQKVVL